MAGGFWAGMNRVGTSWEKGDKVGRVERFVSL
jgi:hypothetical protein